MSAPQRSSGRLVSRRVPPASGTPGNPVTVAQTRAVGRGRVPQPSKSMPAAEIVVGEPATPVAGRGTAGGPIAPARRGVTQDPGPVNDREIAAGRVVNDRGVTAGRAVNDRGIAADRGPTNDRVAGGDRGGSAVRRGDGMSTGPHPVELAGLLHELSVRMLGADDVPQALDRLAALVAGAVPGVLRCSVALIGEGGPPMLAASGTRAKALDDRQYRTGHGPGLEAARNRVLVTANELQSDPRWPELAECAREEGVHGVVSFPLDVQRTSVGSLSLFVGQPGGVAPELLLTTMAVVNQAEVLLGELRRREGLSEGATVDRAAGVIIAQRGCGVQEAYDVLRETSQRLGMDRRAVAERLIAAAARNAEG